MGEGDVMVGGVVVRDRMGQTGCNSRAIGGEGPNGRGEEWGRGQVVYGETLLPLRRVLPREMSYDTRI